MDKHFFSTKVDKLSYTTYHQIKTIHFLYLFDNYFSGHFKKIFKTAVYMCIVYNGTYISVPYNNVGEKSYRPFVNIKF